MELKICQICQLGEFLGLCSLITSDKLALMKVYPDKKIPVPEFRRLLGKAGIGLSDAEVEHMRNLADRFANIVFDSWLRERNAPTKLANAPKNDII